MLDKWAFGMSKIDGEGRESGSGSPMAVNDVSKTVVDKEKEGEGALVQAAEGISISSTPFGQKSNVLPPGAGPSLLSQQAPRYRSDSDHGGDHGGAGGEVDYFTVPTAPAVVKADGERERMAVDVDGDVDGDALGTQASTERITVKIADLGNGECSLPFPSLSFNSYPHRNSNMDRTPFHRRYPNPTIPLPRSHPRRTLGSERGHLERRLRRLRAHYRG
jgi:hypothetical protein